MLQMWMVGRQIGVDRGGILNRSPTLCPEDSTVDWEYWSTAWEVSAVRKIKTPIYLSIEGHSSNKFVDRNGQKTPIWMLNVPAIQTHQIQVKNVHQVQK